MEPEPDPARADDRELLAWLAAFGSGAPADLIGRAISALRRVCPIVTGLLLFDHRLSAEVERQLGEPTAARTVEDWGVAFAQRLVGDPDAWISWAAQVDAGTLAVGRSRRRIDPSCPGDPVQAILLITAGNDPR